MTKPEPIRVMIVDDHTIVREGLATLLDADPMLMLVGEAPDGGRAIPVCNRVQPDVILMDLIMPEVDGITAIQTIMDSHPEMRILVLTSFVEHGSLQAALDAGAIGYLLKNTTAKELAHAIKMAHAGKSPLAPEAAQSLVQAATASPPMGHDLTPRETEALTHLVEGLTNAEIAQRMGIRPSTAKNHIANILAKLDAASRTEAATTALKHNLLNPSE